MSESKPSASKALTPIAEQDYEAIEAAVMETQRGRWFLAEYARRNRNADTAVILDAIARLENAVAHEREGERLDRLRFDLVEMARAITSTKREIAAIRPSEGTNSDLEVASEALDGIVRTTERATSDILEAAENVQEAAWTLREDGAREDLCDELDRRATEIYTSCSFQDLTAQRTKRIIETLRFLEGRINAMIDIWGGTVEEEDTRESAEDPRREGLQSRLDVFEGLDQDAIDGFIVEDAEDAEVVTRPSLALVETVDAGEDAAEDMTAEDVEAFALDTEAEEIDSVVEEAVAEPEAEAVLEAEVALETEAGFDPLELVAASDDLAFVETAAEEVAEQDEAMPADSMSADAMPADAMSADAMPADAMPANAMTAEAEPAFDADDILARADATAEIGFDPQAFAEIDRLSTREKLARFS